MHDTGDGGSIFAPTDDLSELAKSGKHPRSKNKRNRKSNSSRVNEIKRSIT